MLGVQGFPALTPDPRRYPAPVSARRALAVIELLRVPRAGCVLDLAAGSGGLLLDAVALHDCRDLGLVASESLAVAARAAASGEGLAARVDFTVGPGAEFVPARRFDAILCVGPAVPPFGSLEATAARCLEWLRVGGVLVLGEPFFRRAPAPSYRVLLGEAGMRLRMTGASASSVVGAGFELLVAAVCSESEWDAHESAAYRATLNYAASRHDEFEAKALRARADAWYQAYWRYGRDTLGFAFHAFRKPRALAPVAGLAYR
ncbi:MAG TPA: class I SAM-dependent methyltransferase [Steroidobacteraceae bacterium]|nr:class I SAM-dependent methyltransferase [Steroidobacteraceae bacterium]